jgi:Leucine-rich repeat (LRR) protein
VLNIIVTFRCYEKSRMVKETYLISIFILAAFGLSESSKCKVDRQNLWDDYTVRNSYDRVVCTNVNFRFLSTYQPELQTYQILTIANSSLPSLPRNLHLPSTLKELVMSNLSIATIPSETFNNLQYLQELDLSSNNLRHIQPGVFQLEQLKVLRLSRNLLSHINPNSFIHLRNLKELYLDQNSLRSIEPSFFNNLQNLEVFNISSNPLHSFPDVKFTYLKSFLASNTYLRRIQADLTADRFWRINISNSHLEEIDFRHFHSVALDLSNNSINVVKNWNKLKVHYLYLSWNNIEDLGEIAQNVTYLYLAHNRIRFLGQVFSHRRNIQTLDLSFNRIGEINSVTFAGLKNLTTLYLPGNMINVLQQNLFINCVNLKYLDLSFNRIRMIEPNAFNGAHRLSRLNISNNDLQSLNFTILSKVKLLTDLSFNNNRISKIDLDQFTHNTPNLKSVALNKNDWDCDNIRNILHYLIDRNIKITDQISFYGTTVSGISCKTHQRYYS